MKIGDRVRLSPSRPGFDDVSPVLRKRYGGIIPFTPVIRGCYDSPIFQRWVSWLEISRATLTSGNGAPARLAFVGGG